MNPALARLLLGAAYPLLAHAASARHDPRLAALALFDILLILLVAPLARGRLAAWAAVALAALVLWRVQASALLPVLLLLPPVLFAAMVAWWFARTLRPGSVPLITRIASRVEDVAPADMAPALLAYTRRLTRLWALLLAGLALANLLLGLVAVPDGVLARLGYAPVVAVPQAAWSWFANILDYGIVAGMLVVEYVVRTRLFPDRPHRGLVEFLRRMGTLGPALWHDVRR